MAAPVDIKTRHSYLSAKGARRVKEILTAAAEILLESGFRAVNKRSVARRLGISDGNVSYYFPSTESLWLAVIDHEFAEYYDKHHPASNVPADDPQAVFDEYVERWIDEYQDPLVRIFFSQMIAVAESIESIAAKRNQIYDVFVETMTRLAAPLVTDISDAELERRVLTAIALLEGFHAVSAIKPEIFSDDASYKRHVVMLVNQIIRTESSQGR